jgi:hypothetical protein
MHCVNKVVLSGLVGYHHNWNNMKNTYLRNRVVKRRGVMMEWVEVVSKVVLKKHVEFFK